MNKYDATDSTLSFSLENELYVSEDIAQFLAKFEQHDDDGYLVKQCDGGGFYGTVLFSNPQYDPPSVYMSVGVGVDEHKNIKIGNFHFGRDDAIRLAAYLKALLSTWPKDEDHHLDEKSVFG